MYLKNALISLFIFLPILGFSQIKIDDVGDGWKMKVDSAISVIKNSDPDKYNILIENCKHVEFIIGDYSTTKPPDVIAITVKDMKRGSLNNIAAILVHESYHLMLFNNHRIINANTEEKEAYMYEYDFLCKLPNVEDWLFLNAINMIIRYSK